MGTICFIILLLVNNSVYLHFSIVTFRHNRGPATGDSNWARKSYARQARTKPFLHHVNLIGHKDKIPRLSNEPIIFTEDEERGLWHLYIDAIVVTLRIAGRKLFWILVDNRSSNDILFKSTLNMMNLIGAKIDPTTSLFGFIKDNMFSERILNLPAELWTSPCQHIQEVDFFIVDCPSPYNTIIGHPKLNRIWAMTSTKHLLVKFPTVGGLGVLRGDQTESRENYEAAKKLAIG